ncbi:O-antigen polysaccharide polymerase Wzy [Chitinophaga sp. Mgbs1]|uniref:O-antigen polysaccharide polymerase Wzy n=1 Tax=Chitinophaga solisilvae TaxID=1233460 RepID=A0A3S1AZS4_9BACT|nr:O-antigen polysaccharide polymerase Wzy [Chitinophaga solisilvae]
MNSLKAIIIQIVFILVIFTVSSFIYDAGIQEFELTLSYLIVIQFAWQSLNFFRLNDTVVSIFYFFLLAGMLFNGGGFFVKIFNPTEYTLMTEITDLAVKRDTIIFVALCFSFLYLGALLYLNHGNLKSVKTIVYNQPVYIRTFRVVGFALLAVSIVFEMSYMMDSLQVAMANGYYALYGMEKVYGVDSVPKILRDFYIPALYILYWCDVNSGNRRSLLWMIMIFVHCMLLFMIGFRGHSIMPILGFAILYDRCVARINIRKSFIIGAAVLFFVFPLIKNYRNAADKPTMEAALEYLGDSFRELAILKEMGSSVKTVGYTQTLVPAERDYAYGSGYFWAMTSIFPNIFTNGKHPAIENAHYSQWLTERVNPHAAAAGGGVGYSFIAEAYMNFSIFGVFFMVLLGYMLVKLDVFVMQKNTRLILAASFTSFFLMYGRGEFLFVVRSLLWYSIGPYLMYKFLLQRAIKPKLFQRINA